MKSSNREEIVDHDAEGLFDIVLDIESYPYFIPWCSAMRIHSKNKNEIYADMVVWYKYFMPQTFGSHVTFDKKKLSKTNLADFAKRSMNSVKLPFSSRPIVAKDPCQASNKSK